MDGTEITSRLRAGMSQIRAELEEAQVSLKAAGDEVAQRLQPALDRLQRTGDAASAALRRLEQEATEAGEVLASDIDREYHQLTAELEILRSELRSEVADSVESYQRAANEHLSAWRTGLEELRLRASLAKMEARDELSALVDRLESTYHDASRHLRESGNEAALTTLRERLRGTFQDLRTGADNVVDALKRHQQDRT